MVDFPDADSPVNQMVNPRCLRSSLRSRRDSEACHVMLLRRDQYQGPIEEAETLTLPSDG